MKFKEIIKLKIESYKYFDEKSALKAVEQNGYALQYVKEQTEAICLKAVEQNGDALKYVKEQLFILNPKELTVAQISEILGYDIKIIITKM